MSVLKGFTSLFNSIKSDYNGGSVSLQQLFATFRYLGAGKAGTMVSSMWLSIVSSGNTLDAGSTKRVLSKIAHGHRIYDVIRFTSGALIGLEVQIVGVGDANAILLGQELPTAPGVDGYTVLRPMTPTLDSSGQMSVVEGITTVVDFLDNGSMVPTGANVIPRSSAAPLQVVAALAGNITKIQSVSDVGEFINIYSDAAGATLIAHLVLTPDAVVDVDIAVGSSVYFRAAKDVNIDDVNSILSMNFIG